MTVQQQIEPTSDPVADAAHVLRVTAAACHAHLLGEQERLETLLGQLTPNMCSELAVQLEELAGGDDFEAWARMTKRLGRDLARLDALKSGTLHFTSDGVFLDDGTPVTVAMLEQMGWQVTPAEAGEPALGSPGGVE